MNDETPKQSIQDPKPTKPKSVTRQGSIPTSMLSNRPRTGSNPQPDFTSRTPTSARKLTNGTKVTTNGIGSQQPPVVIQSARKHSNGITNHHLRSAKLNDSTEKAAVLSNKKPEFGKGRLERGKQISHLGLFPQLEIKQVQRQSTSMNAEAGDHPADLQEVLSPNPTDKKLSVQWKKQIDHIARSLSEYTETHPQFSSQLASTRLEKIIGLKTAKPLKGDQLTITMTFSTSPMVFDFRTPKQPGKKTSISSNEKRHIAPEGESTQAANDLLPSQETPDCTKK